MVSVDIVHGLSGHCPWTQWTMSMDSVDFLQMGSVECGLCLHIQANIGFKCDGGDI